MSGWGPGPPQVGRHFGGPKLCFDEAARRFDLSPLDTDFLFRHLAERAKRT